MTLIFIAGNLKYDTKKMERIAEVEKWCPSRSSLFTKVLADCTLWRSKKGRWLLTYEDEHCRNCCQVIKESKARSLLREQAPEAYEKLYGELEEA